MSNNGGLINLGDLSRPATVLIEKISDAVGGIAKPWQIKRVARAEGEAALIEANARVEVSEIERRALIRMVREEGKKQENIENITAQALPHLAPDAKPENVEQDWLTHFFDRCRLVSDQQMQSIWSSILAGQANVPGTFSKKTIELVATLDKSDAELFSNLCSYVWVSGTPVPLIFDIQHSIYTGNAIHFQSLSHLADLGTITFEPLTGYERQRLPRRMISFYYGQPVELELPKEIDNSVSLGKVLLTRAGQELLRVIAAKPLPAFKEYVLKHWEGLGYKILEPNSPAATK